VKISAAYLLSHTQWNGLTSTARIEKQDIQQFGQDTRSKVMTCQMTPIALTSSVDTYCQVLLRNIQNVSE